MRIRRLEAVYLFFYEKHSRAQHIVKSKVKNLEKQREGMQLLWFNAG